MKHFITIPIIHPNNVEGDTTASLAIEEIIEIHTATVMDKKQRSEVKSLIFRKNGTAIATTMPPQSIISLIHDVEKEYPE